MDTLTGYATSVLPARTATQISVKSIPMVVIDRELVNAKKVIQVAYVMSLNAGKSNDYISYFKCSIFTFQKTSNF